MIKRLSLVALAVFAAGNANAIQVVKDAKNDVQITGLAYAAHIFGDEKNSESYGSNTFARFGAKGKTAINDKLTAIGTYEAQLKLNDPENEQSKDVIYDSEGNKIGTGSNSTGTNVRTRFIFGGIDAKDIGTFTYGRQNGAVYSTVANWTDVGLTDGYSGNATGIGADKFGQGRGSDILKYSGVYGPATLAASYKFATARDSDTLDKDNSAYGLAAAYEIVKNFNLGAAYSNGKRSQTSNYVEPAEGKFWAAGAKYDDKTIYAALIYADANDFLAQNVDHIAYETALGYTFSNGIGLLTTWEKQRVDDNGTKKDGYNAYTLGASYAFSKALSVAAEYRINNREKNDYNAFTEYGASGAPKVDSANDFQLALKYLF